MSIIRCSNCNISPESLEPGLLKGPQVGLLKACGRCRKVYYCSRSCQKKDWKSHKLHCFVPKGSQSLLGRAKEGKGQGTRTITKEKSISIQSLQPDDSATHHPAALGSDSSTNVYDPDPASYSNLTEYRVEAIVYEIIFPKMELITPEPLSLHFMSVPSNNSRIEIFLEPGGTISKKQIIDGFGSSIPGAVKKQIYSYMKGVGRKYSRHTSAIRVTGIAEAVKVSGLETAPSLIIYPLREIQVLNPNRECETCRFEVRDGELWITDK